MEWKYIDEIESLEGMNMVHCDTRDFHCKISDEKIDTKDGRNPKVRRVFYKKEYQIPGSELLKWLKSIETMTGGKGSWRCPIYREVECDGWLKYIRCYRNPKRPEYFVVCNRDSVPILWERCTEDRLEKEYLNFIK